MNRISRLKLFQRYKTQNKIKLEKIVVVAVVVVLYGEWKIKPIFRIALSFINPFNVFSLDCVLKAIVQRTKTIQIK